MVYSIISEERATMTTVDSSRHALDDALTLTGAGDRLTGRTTAAYANMVGPFGGITAATVVRAIEQHPDVLGEPVSLTANFVGPIAAGEFAVYLRIVRTNRTTQHWYVELSQDDSVTTTATAVFALRRPTWSATELEYPDVPAADAVPATAFPPAFAWGSNYEMRYTAGNLTDIDGTTRDDSVTTLWIRDHPLRPVDFGSLTAMSDAFFPRVFRRKGQPGAAGTVSLTTYFHADSAALRAQGTEPILGTARGNQFGLGYFDQSAQLWGVDRTLLATSHQVVYYKD